LRGFGSLKKSKVGEAYGKIITDKQQQIRTKQMNTFPAILLIANSWLSINIPNGTARIAFSPAGIEQYSWTMIDSSNQRSSGSIQCGSGSVWVNTPDGKRLAIELTTGNSNGAMLGRVIRDASPCLR